MRRLTAWIGGVASGVVAYRFWRRHTQAAAEPAPAPETTEPDNRAEELREKLAESRAEVEPSPAEPAEAPEAVEERRQRVHEEGRAALDEMKSDESALGGATVSAEPVSFERDLKPLFRERDRGAMASHFDLWSYDDVSANADAILAEVEGGGMPCDGPWDSDRVETFRRWMQGGKGQ